MYLLSGKYVLITGSTDGLGKQIALALAKEGANIIVHGRSEEKVTATIEELKKVNESVIYTPLICELANSEEIAEKFSIVKKLDIYINNAGIWFEGNTLDTTPEKIIELTKVNLLAPLLISRTLLPILLESEFSQILNVVSIAGVEIPAGYYHTAYSAVKIGLQGFTEAVAKEFFNKNLRVMGYYPGGMETNFFEKAGMSYKKHEPWMFDPQESVEAIIFMLTRDPKVSIKRMDLINQLEI